MKYPFKSVLWRFLICAVLCSMVTACDEVDNVLKGRSYMYCRFVDKKTLQEFGLDSLKVTALNTVKGDSILSNSRSKVTNVSSALSYVNNKTVLVFTYTRSLSDTLWIFHTNSDHFVSMNAGISVYHQIDSVKYTSHNISSIQVINPRVDTNEKENIRILY